MDEKTSGTSPMKARPIRPLDNTMLEGLRLPLTKTAKAADVFIKADKGISAEALGEQTGMAYLTARKLIDKFHRALAPRPEERLIEPVQIAAMRLTLRPKGKKHDAAIAIAVVRKSNGLANMIALGTLDDAGNRPWLVYMNMLKGHPTIEMHAIEDIPWADDIPRALEYYGYKVAMTDDDICEDIKQQITDTLGRTYRYAIAPDHLQGYLNEIAYRWNNRREREPAARVLMERLTKRPAYIHKPEPPSNREDYWSWVARP